ncbi:hypothetical protein KCP73_26365 [Salmonella enterica subsp. enterica]|nr:hypothetical protein KCP73_26365 [Salmonella enterica subsp. enterica]
MGCLGHGANHEYGASVGKRADSRSIAETAAGRRGGGATRWIAPMGICGGPPAAAKPCCRAARRDAVPVLLIPQMAVIGMEQMAAVRGGGTMWERGDVAEKSNSMLV